MSYTSVFGGNTIYPSDVSYLAVALDADIELEWPLESSGELPPAARILDVTPDASGWSIVLPDATLTGAGQTLLFNNLSGSESFYVKDNAGGTLATIAHGEQWQVYLAATTTAAGTWRVFRYGASTATVQPSSLAGFGLTVTDSTLSQSLPVTTFSTTGLTVATSNRASAFVWTASGAGVLNLLTAASAGNNFFVFVRNEGGGDLTIEPAGSETINNSPNLALRPGDSCTIITDGAEWYTIGLGQQAVFAFDYTSISITGGNYTLAGSELNRIAYKFVGTLGSDAYIIVPPTIQQYWINNATSGAFSLFVQTSGGTPVEVNQGAKGIYYCDGTNLVLASDPTTLTTPLVVADGGTGATTASGARLSLGITPFADAIVTATTGASVRTTITAAKSGANSDITSMGALTSITGSGDILSFVSGTTSSGVLFTDSVASIRVGSRSGAFTVDTNSAERLRIDTSGNVGIGTASPQSPLDVNGNARLRSGEFYFTSGTTILTRMGVGTYTSDSSVLGIGTDNGTCNKISFITAGSQRVRIDENGNFGIATTTPARKFDVAGGGRFMQDTGATTGAVVLRQNSGDTVGGFIQWVNNANTAEKGWMVVDTSSNMIFAPNSAEAVRFTSAGNVGIGTSTPAAKLDVNGSAALRATTYFGSSAVCNIGADATQLFLRGANIAFQDASASTTRMYLNSSGNLGIGTSSPSYKLEVVGDIRLASGGDLRISSATGGNDMTLYSDASDLYFANGSTQLYLSATGSLTATGNVTAYSDARLKTDLQKIEGALDKIEKLTGYTFTRIDSGERQTGLVAQDVQAVLPEAVVEGEHLSVAYGNMLGLVVEAIKELRADFNELRQQAVKVIKP